MIAALALRDLMRDRFFLLCNVAIMVGILVPFLVLFGVKNGVYQALIGEMLADPATRQIDTLGNATLTQAQIDTLRGWPEVAFVTPKTRSQFDYINFRAEGGRRILQALLVPSGQGDPNLPEGLVLNDGDVVISAGLGKQLELSIGQSVQLITQADGRPRQLLLHGVVVAILPDASASGYTVFTRYNTADLIEAFYDSYALPDYGITNGRPLDERVNVYEGLRVYARRLEDLAPLQARIEASVGVATVAKTAQVESLLGLGRNLDLALALTATLSALGLGAALIFGFWTDVARKRDVLATIALLGVPSGQLALFPIVQALVTAVLGLLISFALYLVGAHWAAALFLDGLPGDAAVAQISMAQAGIITGGVLALVIFAAGFAAWNAQRLDPARVLREGG